LPVDRHPSSLRHLGKFRRFGLATPISKNFDYTLKIQQMKSLTVRRQDRDVQHFLANKKYIYFKNQVHVLFHPNNKN
jgi:uncharacterized protein YneR